MAELRWVSLMLAQPVSSKAAAVADSNAPRVNEEWIEVMGVSFLMLALR